MALLVDKFGRRPTFLASTGGMFVTFIFWTLTAALHEEQGSPGANYAMIAFIWVFNIMYAMAWSGLLIGYSIEILPYKLRAKGLLVVQGCVQAALALNNYANPVAFEAFEGTNWKLYLIYTVSPVGFPVSVIYLIFLSAGSALSSVSSTSSTSRPRAPRSRSWPRLSTVMTPRLLS